MYDLDEEKHSLCLLLQQSNETKDRTVRNIFSVSIEQKVTFQNKHSAGILSNSFENVLISVYGKNKHFPFVYYYISLQG